MDFVQLIQVVGVPVACLAAMAWAVWTSLRALYRDFLLPLVADQKKQTTLLSQMVTTQERLVQNQDRQSEALSNILATQESQQKQIAMLLAWMERSQSVHDSAILPFPDGPRPWQPPAA